MRVAWTNLAAETFTAPVIALLIGALLVIAVGLVLLAVQHRSLRQLRQGAERFAAGDLSRKVTITGMAPLADLAESLNRMALQIDERYQSAIRQRNELEAVLSSMVEGVVVVDPQEQVVSANAAAGRLLDVDPAGVAGRSIQEVARNTSLQRFIGQALQTDRAIQDDLTLHKPGNGAASDHYLQVQSAPLRDGAGRRIGVVIVLHDVSELRRLEGVRRDFVANVSHEIKTPVTAIRGFVETLLDNGEHSVEDTQRFLQIIGRQADRLHAIVSDLLTLSRIEQDAKEKRIEKRRVRLASMLHAAAESCAIKAQAKRIAVQVDCVEDLFVPADNAMIEQAVINLVDNAIKYSPEGAAVRVEGRSGDGSASILVRDQGCGIEPAHLPRLFERFYRTDKARSRELGGTGLGLAIVKHIAQAHGGTVNVESQIGKGSTFHIRLPLNDSIA